MKKFKITYGSMTACYNLGCVWANNQEEAERKARGKASSFSAKEKPLIKAREVTVD